MYVVVAVSGGVTMISQCPHSWLSHLYHVLHLKSLPVHITSIVLHTFQGIISAYLLCAASQHRHMFPAYLQLDTA